MSQLQVTVTKSITGELREKRIDVNEFSDWVAKGWSIKKGEASKIIKFARENDLRVGQLIGASPNLSKEEAIASYQRGDISEGQLAHNLGTDRLSARIILQDYQQRQ